MRHFNSGKARLTLTALVGVLIAAGSTLADQPEEKDNAQEAGQRVETAAYLYLYRISLAQREWLANHVTRTRQILAECPPELRGWEWYYLSRLCRTELISFNGHASGAWDVAFSPDGEHIASTGFRHVKLWEASTGKEMLTFSGHQGWVASVAFSPDGRHVCSAGFSTIKIWDATNGKEVLAIPAHDLLIKSVAYSPDGTRVVSASGSYSRRGQQPSGEVKVWNVETGERLLTISDTHWVNSVTFSPDGRWIASGSGDLAIVAPWQPGTVKIWDASTGEEVLDLRGHDFWITSVAFSPDGRRLASAGADKVVKVWDVTTGKEMFTLQGHGQRVNRVAFSPDGNRIASAGDDETTRLWDAETGRELSILRGQSGQIRGLAFGPDGNRLATASGSTAGADGTLPRRIGEVKVWNIASDQSSTVFREHTDRVSSIAFSPDGKFLASFSESLSSARPGEVILRDASTGRVIHTFHDRFMGFNAVVFTPNSQGLLALGGEGVKQWDVSTGQEALTLRIRIHPVFGLAISPDGKRIATGGATIWDSTSGEKLFETKGHTIRGHVTGLAFSPDGTRLASASWGGNLDIRVDGKEKIIKTPNEVKICDAKSGDDLLTLDGGGHGVTYSPDGRLIASGGPDGTIKIWKANDGQLQSTLHGHSGQVACLDFSPDGRRIATGGADQTVKIWDTLTGLESLTLCGHTGNVTDVEFSPDGHQLASASEDRTVRLWDASH